MRWTGLLAASVVLMAGMLAPQAATKKAPAGGDAGVVDRIVPSFTDRAPIHFHAEGHGSPALVFIHCWSCDSSFWSNQLPVFSKSRRVVVLDLAGHGKSGRDRAAWTVKGFAGDVKTVVEELHLRRVVLIGHSMGGAVALEAARIMAERVVAVIAVDTLHDADDRMTPEQRDAFLAPLEADFHGGTVQFVQKLFPDQTDPQLVQQVAEKMASATPGPAVAMLKELMSYDEAKGLAAVRAPVRCINSDKFPTNVEANRKYSPGFDAVILKGVGHFPQLEKPAEFNETLSRMLDKIAPVKP